MPVLAPSVCCGAGLDDAEAFQDFECVVDAGEGGDGGAAPHGECDPQAATLLVVVAGGAGDGGVGGDWPDVDGDAEHGDDPFGEWEARHTTEVVSTCKHVRCEATRQPLCFCLFVFVIASFGWCLALGLRYIGVVRLIVSPVGWGSCLGQYMCLVVFGVWVGVACWGGVGASSVSTVPGVSHVSGVAGGVVGVGVDVGGGWCW